MRAPALRERGGVAGARTPKRSLVLSGQRLRSADAYPRGARLRADPAVDAIRTFGTVASPTEKVVQVPAYGYASLCGTEAPTWTVPSTTGLEFTVTLSAGGQTAGQFTVGEAICGSPDESSSPLRAANVSTSNGFSFYPAPVNGAYPALSSNPQEALSAYTASTMWVVIQ